MTFLIDPCLEEEGPHYRMKHNMDRKQAISNLAVVQ